MGATLKDPARDRAAEVGEGAVAVLNAGSSSIKFAVYQGAQDRVALRGRLEKIGVEPALQVTDGTGRRLDERHWPSGALDHRAGTAQIIQIVRELLGGAPVTAVGHRVVHGGTRYAAPVR